MTPQPPSSSDGSPLPPRHRPNMSSLGKDTTEFDLWDFDDEDAPSAQSIPTTPRDPSPAKPARPKPQKKPGPGDKPAGSEANPLQKRKPTHDPAFEDLEAWDDSPQETGPVLKLTPEKPKAAPAPTPAPPPPPAPVEPAEPEPVVNEDEFSPTVRADVAPVALPKLGLTKVERIGLGALVLLLLTGGTLFVANSLNRLPTRSARVEANDFPLKGTRLTVVSAASFWREPVREGPKADSFRRGTQLLPAVDLDIDGGPAAVRIFFRNSDGDLVGDPVTRAARNGETRLSIAASAGFDDIGLHAAYRAGESKPWTIEVHEGPSEDAPGQDFKKLFEMTVSTDRR